MLAGIEHHIVGRIELVEFAELDILDCIVFGKCCIVRYFLRSEH